MMLIDCKLYMNTNHTTSSDFANAQSATQNNEKTGRKVGKPGDPEGLHGDPQPGHHEGGSRDYWFASHLQSPSPGSRTRRKDKKYMLPLDGLKLRGPTSPASCPADTCRHLQPRRRNVKDSKTLDLCARARTMWIRGKPPPCAAGVYPEKSSSESQNGEGEERSRWRFGLCNAPAREAGGDHQKPRRLVHEEIVTTRPPRTSSQDLLCF